MRKGAVMFLRKENGYGFIRDRETLGDYFFAANEMGGRFTSLEVGDSVVFRVVADETHGRRPKAVEVYRIEEEGGLDCGH